MALYTLGKDAKLYYNTGTYGSPTWNEVTQVRNVTLSLTTSEADVTTRSNSGWRAMAPVLKDGSLGFDMVYDNTDTDYEKFRDAFHNQTLVELLIVDGAYNVSGNEGVRGSFMVSKFDRKEELENAIIIEVTCRPGLAANPPATFTGSGS
jgi:hypothetical protein